MNPEEIEFKILYTMYCQHFKSGGLANATDRGIAIEAGLEDVDPNEIRSVIDYLVRKGFMKIGGKGESGYQLFIGITPKGIEKIQSIADKSMSSLSEDFKETQFLGKLDEIANESEPIKRTRDFFDIALQNLKLAKYIFNISKPILQGGS